MVLIEKEGVITINDMGDGSTVQQLGDRIVRTFTNSTVRTEVVSKGDVTFKTGDVETTYYSDGYIYEFDSSTNKHTNTLPDGTIVIDDSATNQ